MIKTCRGIALRRRIIIEDYFGLKKKEKRNILCQNVVVSVLHVTRIVEKEKRRISF